MQHLIDGYKRFRATEGPRRQALFETLAEKGQRPRALVLTCVDSRIDPAMIFDAGPGELLVVRNVANIVPPYEPGTNSYHGTSAALEFGVQVLEVPHLIVMGHGRCGGVRALLEGAPATARDFVAPWMSIANDARDRAMTHPAESRQKCCEHEVVKVSLSNLMTFPWIAERVDTGRLTLHGAWFAIKSCTLELLQPDGAFAAVSM